MKKTLTISDHNREILGFRYVYPVVSRRAGGVSIGINLNINNACNWRCIYCNVPELSRGTPPPIELDVLEQELRTLLTDVLHGDFMQQYVDKSDRVLQDIAFSGNGEPTSAKEFPAVVQLVETIINDFKLQGKIKLRLITNGSMLYKPAIIKAVKQLAQCNGEVWFKLDAGSSKDIAAVNDIHIKIEGHLKRLRACAGVCPTYIQTCLFAIDGAPPSEEKIAVYLNCIGQVKDVIEGVHIYGIARQSMQPEASRLSQLSTTWLETFAERVRRYHPNVYVSP